MSQVRRVYLRQGDGKVNKRVHLLYGEPLKSAQEASAIAPAKQVIMTDEKGKFGTSETVFVFRNTSHVGAADPDKHSYNTYDFRITEFDPATNSFYLTGRYLLNNTTETGSGKEAGLNLITHASVNGEIAQIYTGDLLGKELDGRILVPGK